MKITIPKTTTENIEVDLPTFFQFEEYGTATFCKYTESGCVSVRNHMITFGTQSYIYQRESIAKNGFDEITEDEFNAELDKAIEQIKSIN